MTNTQFLFSKRSVIRIVTVSEFHKVNSNNSAHKADIFVSDMRQLEGNYRDKLYFNEKMWMAKEPGCLPNVQVLIKQNETC